MKTLNFIIFSFLTLLLGSCGIFKDVFVNNYDGAGHFRKLITNEKGTINYVDSLSKSSGYDAIVMMHLKIHFITDADAKPDEIREYPEVLFTMSDEYINSHPDVKEGIRRRGIFASLYKNEVYARWSKADEKGYERNYDSYLIFEAKSKVNKVFIEDVLIRYLSEGLIQIFINEPFIILPDKLNYIGTLTINLQQTAHLKGNIQKGYATSHQYEYVPSKKLEFTDSDYENDIRSFESNFPHLYKDFKNKIQK